MTQRLPAVIRRSFLPAVALLGLALVAACGRNESEDDSNDEYDPAAEAIEQARAPKRNVAPPYLLDDRLVARTGNALRDLRAAWQKQNGENPAAGAMTIGPGIGYAVKGADSIVRPHGFERIEDFELALRHVQMALSVVVARESFGSQHRDFDGGTLRKKLGDDLASLKKARDSVERDQTLSLDDRRSRVLDLDDEIVGIESRLSELDSISANFGSERAHVPEGNVECVHKVREALLPLFIPITSTQR